MGQLKHDGRATQGGVTFPAGVITFGDLYRVDGFSGFAMKSLAAADTVRTADMELAKERVWYVKLPAGLTPAKGDLLAWSAGAGFKRGDTDLIAMPVNPAAGAAIPQPVCQVEETKDANGFAAVRLTGLA